MTMHIIVPNENAVIAGAIPSARRWQDFLSSLAVPAAVAVLYFATAVASIYLAKRAGGVLLFPSTAILLVALIRSQTSSWPVLIALTAIADVTASMLMMDARAAMVAAVCFANMLEGLLVATALRRFQGGEAWFLSWRCIGVFIVSSALAAMIASAAVALLAVLRARQELPEIALTWFHVSVVDTLGLIMIGSLLLCWTEQNLQQRLTPRLITEIILGTSIVAVVSHFAFSGGFALLFMIFPLLALFTVRTGLFGATAGAAALTAIAAWYTAAGKSPIELLPNFAAGSPVLVLQLYFIGAVLSTSPIAVTLTLRDRLAKKLQQQHEISRAALDNMVEGLCMFDAQQRLITCNPQFAQIYDLPGRLLRPGTAFAEILNHQITSGTAEGTTDNSVQEFMDEVRNVREHSEIELPNGRIIDIHRRQLANGGWIATHEDITESRRAADQIAYLANHDPLTGLPNRAFFRDQLERAVANAERGQAFALLCLDLDRFKSVNDTMGHAAGDELLKQVADRLRQAARAGDVVARLGGDEFAIIQFPVDRRGDVSSLAGRIVASLGKPYHINGVEVLSGTSVGIALAPSDTVDMADLLQKSDLALYRAKADGRGSYRFFEGGMDSVLRKRRLLEVELRSALSSGEFELYYQPILDLESDAITSFEALLRWEHPIRGVISSGEFIPVAEDCGLIIPIGEWALREACKEAAGWPNDVKVAVNLSPVQFKDRRLVSTIENALAESGLSPARLELEVTESVLINDPDTVLKMLEQIHALGVSISMDDFGTGYSGLSYLRSFPFDKIKIDQSFIKDISNSDSLAIVHATVELSSRLGLTTTAEGVETAEQLAILQAQGCNNIQGFYVGKPLPALHVLHTLRNFDDNGSEIVLRKSA